MVEVNSLEQIVNFIHVVYHHSGRFQLFVIGSNRTHVWNKKRNFSVNSHNTSPPPPTVSAEILITNTITTLIITPISDEFQWHPGFPLTSILAVLARSCQILTSYYILATMDPMARFLLTSY